MKSFIVTINQNILNVVAIAFAGKNDTTFIENMVREVAEPIFSSVEMGKYFLYIRDIKEYAIDGKYPGGHTYNKYEAMVALPDWDCDRTQIKATLAHELHHLARW